MCKNSENRIREGILQRELKWQLRESSAALVARPLVFKFFVAAVEGSRQIFELRQPVFKGKDFLGVIEMHGGRKGHIQDTAGYINQLHHRGMVIDDGHHAASRPLAAGLAMADGLDLNAQQRLGVSDTRARQSKMRARPLIAGLTPGLATRTQPAIPSFGSPATVTLTAPHRHVPDIYSASSPTGAALLLLQMPPPLPNQRSQSQGGRGSDLASLGIAARTPAWVDFGDFASPARGE